MQGYCMQSWLAAGKQVRFLTQLIVALKVTISTEIRSTRDKGMVALKVISPLKSGPLGAREEWP